MALTALAACLGVQHHLLFLPAARCGHMAEPWPPAQQLWPRLPGQRAEGGGTPGTHGTLWEAEKALGGNHRPSKELVAPTAPDQALPTCGCCGC